MVFTSYFKPYALSLTRFGSALKYRPEQRFFGDRLMAGLQILVLAI
jgi:hypothetical protein